MTIGWLDDARSAVRHGLVDGLSGLCSTELVALARAQESLRGQVEALDVRLVAELQSRSVAGEFARSSTADLLVSELLVTPAEAKARVRRAGDLAARRSLVGEPLPALLPATSAALSDGLIGVDHVRVITDCFEALPAAIDGVGVGVGVVEDVLVRAAQHEHPGALRRTVAALLAQVDPDGIEPREDEIQRRREVTIARYRDGSGRLTGRLTVEAQPSGTRSWTPCQRPAPARAVTRTPGRPASGDTTRSPRPVSGCVPVTCPQPEACRSPSWSGRPRRKLSPASVSRRPRVATCCRSAISSR